MLYNFLFSDHFIWLSLRALTTLLVTILSVRIFRKVWDIFGKDTIHQKFTKNVLSAVIWVIGVIVTLRWFPYFTDVAVALLAGSGIIALTVGLAAQESLGNAFNGLFISLFKPFEVGDRIHLINADITGFVEDITIRHTVIRTFINSRIIIPNSVMNQELIENSNFYNQQASSFIDIIITYSSNVEKACDIMAQIIGDHLEFVDTREPEDINILPKVPVFVRSIGLYGVELRASMWTATVATNFAACSDVRKSILCEFEKAKIDIAHSKIIDPIIKMD